MTTSSMWLNETEVTIIGTGLMGASLAIALRGKVRALHGVDSNPRNLLDAARHLDTASADLEAAVKAADLVILATPVRTILKLLATIAPIAKPGTVILDLGSAKREIVQAMDALPAHLDAIGGHPMCGKEISGAAAADPAIFHKRRFVLCPSKRTTPHAMMLAQQVVTAVKSQLVVMDAADHDFAVAAISHLPYLISSALTGTVEQIVRQDPNGSQAPWQLAATGFHDTSRLSGSDVTMMADTLESNRAAVLAVISIYQNELESLRQLLTQGDTEALRRRLEDIREERRDWFEQFWQKTLPNK